jgi:ATP-dependent DNA helicase PIF1
VPPPEVLQSFEPPSLPPSKLNLKVGAPVMLSRHLYPSQGLCNGTRLTVTRISPCIVEARILDGEFGGQLRLLPHIKLTSTDGELPFILTCTQFPVRLSFAITVNKSQGQSLAAVGVDLRHAVFTHGQLYVALSRVTTLSGLCLLLPVPLEGECGQYIRNIVFSEVLLP